MIEIDWARPHYIVQTYPLPPQPDTVTTTTTSRVHVRRCGKCGAYAIWQPPFQKEPPPCDCKEPS